MKKGNKKRNKLKVIVLIIILIVLIIGLILVKMHYLKLYNIEKNAITVKYKEIDRYVKSSNYSEANYYCINRFCYEKQYGVPISDIAIEKKCSESVYPYYVINKPTKAERCKNILYARPVYDGLKLTSVIAKKNNQNFLSPEIFLYHPIKTINDKKYSAIFSTFLVDYLYHISNPTTNKDKNVGDPILKARANVFNKEFKIFRKKNDIKINENAANAINPPLDYNFWKYYKTYIPEKLYLSDSLFKITDEYHNLKFYNASFRLLSNFDLLGLGFSGYSTDFEITKMNKYYQSNNHLIYIIKMNNYSFHDSIYLVFIDNTIMYGFNNWDNNDVENFIYTLYFKG